MQESVELFQAVGSKIPIPMELLKRHSLEDCYIHYFGESDELRFHERK